MFVAAGSAAVLVIGSEFQESAEDRIADGRVEKSLVERDPVVGDVSTGETGRRTLDLPTVASDAAVRRESTGTVVVDRTDLTSAPETITVKQVGSVVYERDERLRPSSARVAGPR